MPAELGSSAIYKLKKDSIFNMKKLHLILSSILFLNACAPKTGIEIGGAWTRSAAQGENGAIYFTVINHDEGEDALIGVTADFAQAVEIHESMLDHDVMQMDMLASVPLPSGKRVEFAPGGLHIMLVSLTRALEIGETIEVVLHFRNHADTPLTLTVQAGPDHSDMDD
jgi:copper(I)-binding protein